MKLAPIAAFTLFGCSPYGGTNFKQAPGTTEIDDGSSKVIAVFDFTTAPESQDKEIQQLQIKVSGPHRGKEGGPTTTTWRPNKKGDAAPSAIQIKVPRGKERIVEVNAKFEDQNGGSKVDTYGSNELDIEEDFHHVVIQMNTQ